MGTVETLLIVIAVYAVVFVAHRASVAVDRAGGLSGGDEGPGATPEHAEA